MRRRDGLAQVQRGAKGLDLPEQALPRLTTLLRRAPHSLAARITLVPAGAEWRFSDEGTDLGTAWRAPGFDDAAWRKGAALVAGPARRLGPHRIAEHDPAPARRAVHEEGVAGVPGLQRVEGLPLAVPAAHAHVGAQQRLLEVLDARAHVEALPAAEMLAQNPGLGKFVWDEFQNGNEKSLARIMVAVVVIGLIGFALDRVMMALQSFVSRNRTF